MAGISKNNAVARTGLIRASGVNPEAAKLESLQNIIPRYLDNLPTISNQFADGVAVVDFPVGALTYRAFNIFLTNSAAIAGETTPESGTHRVTWAFLSKYMDTVEVEIDGKTQISYSADEILDLNELMRWNVKTGFNFLCFGAPNFFNGFETAEDAYALGTANIRSLRLLIKLKAAWPATMKLNVAALYYPVAKPIGYITTTRVQRYVLAGTGAQTISDIPHGVDLAAIWVRNMNAKQVNNIRLTVDDQTLYDASTAAWAALGQLWGKDHAQLAAGNLFLDFWMEGNPNKGIAALASNAQIRRNADIRLELDMAEAGAEIKIITHHAGLWQNQK